MCCRLSLLLFMFLILLGCQETSPSNNNTDGDAEKDFSEQTDSCEDIDLCADAECLGESSCDSDTGKCICNQGYEALGHGCVKRESDGDLDIDQDSYEEQDQEFDPDQDQDFDIEQDLYEEQELEFEQVIDSDSDFEESENNLPDCSSVIAPTMTIIHLGVKLEFETNSDDGIIETGVSSDPDSDHPDSWLQKSVIALDVSGKKKVFGRLSSSDCNSVVFSFIYDVRESYPPIAGEALSTAIALDDESIIGWATAVENISYGEEVIEEWRSPEKALGQAEGTAFDIVSLGRGGNITLSFNPPISNGDGYDFAVFENSFSDNFLELAYVEVSSDGVNFMRFDSGYLGDTPVDRYGSIDTGLIGGLGGKYRQGYGDPFDLEVFVNREEVLSGLFDLGAIKYVRIVDIIGDGNMHDSFGHPIYDPVLTTNSAGFDLDAIAVLNR